MKRPQLSEVRNKYCTKLYSTNKPKQKRNLEKDINIIINKWIYTDYSGLG